MADYIEIWTNKVVQPTCNSYGHDREPQGAVMPEALEHIARQLTAEYARRGAAIRITARQVDGRLRLFGADEAAEPQAEIVRNEYGRFVNDYGFQTTLRLRVRVRASDWSPAHSFRSFSRSRLEWLEEYKPTAAEIARGDSDAMG